MLGVIPVPRVRHCTRAFDGLPAPCGGAERVVGFVIVVGAEGFAVVYVEGFVWEGFLWVMVVRGVARRGDRKDELGMYGN